MRIKADFDGITAATIKLTQAVRPDKDIRYYANLQLARYCEKYVPAGQNKMLAMPVTITDEYVQYRGPYGHYQYEGVVYSPNIPIMEGDMLVGFFSPPGMPKTKTDRKINYSKDVHPQAQSHWDRAAMARHKNDLTSDIGSYIEKRFEDGQ